MEIKAVIFDLDGVIVSTDALHYAGWKYIADLENIYFDEEINHRLRGVSRMDSLDIILERASKSYTHNEKIELATQKNDYYVKLLDNLTQDDILPGVAETLAYLKNKKIKCAIGSSSKNAKAILKKIGLLTSFDVISDGNDVSRSKPFPDVFLKASEKLSIDSKYCAVVEDAESGIEAAMRAEMVSFAVSDAKKSPHATYRLESLVDICKIV